MYLMEAETCEVCSIGTWIEGNWLLLCDGPGCDKAVHTQCLDVPLDSVPEVDVPVESSVQVQYAPFQPSPYESIMFSV